MTRKAAILTFHFCYNYGAALQSYASRKVLEKFGFDVLFPNYIPVYFNSILSPTRELFNNWGFKSRRFDWRNLVTTVKLKLEERERRKAFDAFRRAYLPEHDVSSGAPSDMAHDFDVFYVGSDQVWNSLWSSKSGFDGYYFLDFLPNDFPGRRIAYAACFGREDHPEEWLGHVIPLLRKFDAISVRNAMSRSVISNQVGESVQQVCDPTLLWNFDEFKRDQNDEGDYILVYSLHKADFPLGRRVIECIKNTYQLPVFQLLGEVPFTDDRLIDRRLYDADPQKWVELISNAKYVITDSFHASLFCLKFEKQFAVYSSGWKQLRIREVLERSGLRDRLVVDELDKGATRAITRDIDFAAFRGVLADEIDASLNFIAGSLGE